MTQHTTDSLTMFTEFFSSDTIEQTARMTGFVQRASKMTGTIFLAVVTFGLWRNANTTFAP